MFYHFQTLMAIFVTVMYNLEKVAIQTLFDAEHDFLLVTLIL